MISRFENFSAFEDVDKVGILNCTKSVGYHETCSSISSFIKGFLNEFL